ncbi:MAG: hypothetical protein RBR06_09720 [Desulfuromonadaceae bacterium]|nr:hypothetical protein [Desulfuromonadaceae bacterium]
MDIFAELKRTTLAAQREQELPDFLAAKVFAILEDPAPFRAREVEIRELIDQIEHYDTYGQTGYIGMGVDSVILTKTLKKLWDEA